MFKLLWYNKDNKKGKPRKKVDTSYYLLFNHPSHPVYVIDLELSVHTYDTTSPSCVHLFAYTELPLDEYTSYFIALFCFHECK